MTTITLGQIHEVESNISVKSEVCGMPEFNVA